MPTAGSPLLVDAVARAREEGRLAAGTDPVGVATRLWLAGHGLLALVGQGVLPADVVAGHSVETTVALLTSAGDDPAVCRASVSRAWRPAPTGPRMRPGPGH